MVRVTSGIFIFIIFIFFFFIMYLLSFLLLVCPLFLFSCFYYLKSIRDPHRRRPGSLLPGPRTLPLIGNIHHLNHNPHQALAKLAKTHGPLMHLKLGFIDTIVVSSPDLARQVLQTHDQVLSARPHPAISYVYNHNKLGMVWLPPDRKWRTLRKICRDHMFSPQKLDASMGLRREKLEKLREFVQECCDSGRVLDIADAAFTTSLNLISASLFSIDFATFGSASSHEFKDLVQALLHVIALPNLADYFPFLKPIDPQGIKRKTTASMGKILKILDEIIDRRLEESGESESNKEDMLHALLEISDSSKEESEFTREDISHLLADLFVAGTESSSTSVEWAMAQLIKNPTKMKKAQNELTTVIGKERHVRESDIPHLPYLQAVIKETFRLHPVAPLLIPHKAEADVEINGYTVPKNAQILVNIWATGRDSSIWSDPDSFVPERFLDGKIDVKGRDFTLIPFGSGRRMCPGMSLALRMVPLSVAVLIKDFDWKLNADDPPEELNMDEKFGLSLQKVVPLKAIPLKL